ncbi:MAG TPA: hypothetical protein VFC39_11455 [Acidobacteriaceae bacterium]|nr:hypothetical protein [Acidobacteriaceae bacterium]
MNHLLDLESKLRTAGSAIGRLETAFARNPSRGIQSNILSLRKLQHNLQGEFAQAADKVGRDVCRYRLLEDRPSLRSFVAALGTFQDAFSQTFESLRKGSPRDRRNLSGESYYLSAFQLAYGFPGSFGLAMTIPNSRYSLFPEMLTLLDQAAITIFDVVTSEASPTSVANTINVMGRAPIASIYDWAKVNSDNDTGAGVEWLRGDLTTNNVVIQVPEFRSVYRSLERITDERTTEERINGVLVGADTRSHRFHFVASDTDESIRGTFVDAISDTQQAQLPARYKAILTKTTEFKFATNSETNTYVLERLERLPRIGDISV